MDVPTDEEAAEEEELADEDEELETRDGAATPAAPVHILGPGFNTQLASGFNGDVRSIVGTSDGGLLVASNFTSLAGRTAIPNRLVRLVADGSVDAGFNARLGTGFNSVVYEAIELSDGKVLVAGNFTSLNGSRSIPNRLVRLNADGSLDHAFNAQLGTGFNSAVWSVAETADGGLLVGGNFTSLNGDTSVPNRLVRLNADGSRDWQFNDRLGTGFGSALYSLDVDAEGAILVGGAFTALNGSSAVPNRLMRLQADGAADSQFNARLGAGFNGVVRTVSSSAQGILVGGAFTSLNGSSSIPNRLVRLDAHGGVDTTLNPGLGAGFNGVVWTAVHTADGGVVVGGAFRRLDGSTTIPDRLVRVTPHGTLDTSFTDNMGTGLNGVVYAVVENAGPDGGYLVGGAFRRLNNGQFIPDRMLYLQDDGMPGPSFNSQIGSGFNGTVRVAQETSDGKVVVGGNFTSLYGDSSIPNRLVRLNGDGSLDVEFNARLGTGFGTEVYDVAEMPDGKILVAGNFTALNGSSAIPNRLVRLNQDGSLDVTFNSRLGTGFGTAVWTVDVTSDGKIVVGGNFTALNGSSAIPNRLVRLNEDGSLDSLFNARLGTGFGTVVRSVAIGADDKIVVGGNFTALNGSSAIPNRLVRLNADGTLDGGFNAMLGTGFGTVVWSVDVTSDGGVLVGGNFTALNGSSAIPNRLVRLQANGEQDWAFNAQLGTGFNGVVYAVTETSDGGVLVGGTMTRLNNNAGIPNRLVLINSNGTVSSEFSRQLGTGFNRIVHTVSETRLSGAGYLVGGTFDRLDGSVNIPLRLVKLHTVANSDEAPVVATPRIVAPVGDEVFGATGLVYGTGEPGRTITLYLDDAELGSALVNERGDWLFRVPTAMVEGYRTVEAVQEDTEVTDEVSFEVMGHTVEGWGAGAAGMGVGDARPADRLVQVASSTGASASTAAVTADGRVVLWDAAGLVDDGDVPVTLSADVVQVAVGDGFVLALTRDGRVVGHGDNSQGQVSVPASVQGAVAVEAGADASYALLSDGTVVAWGSDRSGQTSLPVTLTGTTVVQLSAGADHALALTSSGDVLAWGGNGSGQTTVPPRPEEEPDGDDDGDDGDEDTDGDDAGGGYVGVAAGAYFSLAIDDDGSVVGWGRDSEQQLVVPDRVQEDVRRLDAGVGGAVALLSDGSVSVWGTGAQTWHDPAALERAVVVDVVAGAGHGVALVDRVLVTAPTDGATVWPRPVISGTASPDGFVSLEIVGDGGTVPLAGSVGADGLWTVRGEEGLAPGAYTVTAQSAAGSTDTLTVTVAESDALLLHLVVTPRAVHVERLPDW